MSGCNYFDYLSPDELAEFDAMGDTGFGIKPGDPLLAPPYADQVRLTVFTARAEREQAA